MLSICGTDCDKCNFKTTCGGCNATNGKPFGKMCDIAECFLKGGKECFSRYEKRTIDEFNSLGIPGMPKVKSLNKLAGFFVNLAYPMPNGENVKFLDDNAIYLGNQLEAENCCYGIIAHRNFLVVCTYSENGNNPQLIMYKKRENV